MAVVPTTVRAPSPNRVTSQVGLKMVAVAAAKATTAQVAKATTVQAAALRHLDTGNAIFDLLKKVPHGAFFIASALFAR